VRALIFLAAWLVSASVFAQSVPTPSPAQERLKALSADPVALRAAIDAGKKATFFCANCHGEDGISKTPDVPNLAGQNPAYLLEQIRKFGAGERKDQFMQGLIKVLKDEERVQVAAYFSNMVVRPSPADAAQAAKGKVLFSKLCVRCHGEQARGNEAIARLAGQKLPYLETTIARYRDKTGIRNNQLMSIATASLKNEDITAIANYLTQLP
jgi:cytochrome c553